MAGTVRTDGATTPRTDCGPVECARDLLGALRADDPVDDLLATLAGYDDAALAPVREDRDAALAFWSNCYNAGTQLLLARRPDLYESPFRFVRFFGAPCLTVAGTGVSLDDVEHGILRGSRTKYGLGYLPRLLPDTFEMRHALADPDPRVHFALNCGAASCPAIRVYGAGTVDEQLDLATRTYLDATVEYDPEDGVLTLPRIFLWYRGDFGGARGIRDLLREYDQVPAGATPRLTYRPWDWSRAAAKFVD